MYSAFLFGSARAIRRRALSPDTSLLRPNIDRRSFENSFLGVAAIDANAAPRRGDTLAFCPWEGEMVHIPKSATCPRCRQRLHRVWHTAKSTEVWEGAVGEIIDAFEGRR